MATSARTPASLIEADGPTLALVPDEAADPHDAHDPMFTDAAELDAVVLLLAHARLTALEALVARLVRKVAYLEGNASV
jgi:hypothetical protein